ncbi:MAG: MG2 domain-containing protein, partial [Chthoniobacterales bacterium]
LLIAPVKPLPPGAGWRLVMEAGLPTTDPKLTLPARKEVAIGVVQPFAATTVKAESNRVAGRRLLLDFNKRLGEEVTAESLGRWLEIQPAVPNLKPVVEETSVELQGDFALGVRYRVSLAAGLPAREPTATAARLTREVTFEQIAPRLYFSEFSAHQQTRGARQVRIVAVNVPRLRMTAQLFTGDAIPVALKAYDKYDDYSDTERAPDETYTRVRVEDLPGKEIWSKEFTPGGAVDHENVFTLDWNEILGANVSGVVMLTAESLDPMTPDKKRVGTQTLIQLTDLGAIWKRDREHTSLHIFSLATGKGLPAVRLRLLDRDGHELAQATTDPKGEAELPQSETARWIFATTETDAHVIPIASAESEIPLYRLGVTQESNNADDDGSYANTVFVFTERGVYKPGDTVYVKGYGQDSRSDQPRVPAGKPITLTVTDAKERKIFTKELALSEFGSFDGEIALPQGTLGRYRVQVTGAKGDRLGGSCSFQVQEYKPNAFEIKIPAPPETIGDTQLSLPITAKYLMGKSLSQAKLTWSLVARDDTFAPVGLEAFGFCNTITDFRLNRALDRISQFNAQGDAVVDGNGQAQITTELPVNQKAPQPRA